MCGLSKREVMDYSPSLADRLARSTSTYTVEEIAAEIVDVIRNPMAAWSDARFGPKGATGCLAHNEASRPRSGIVRRRKSSTGRHHTPSIRKRSGPR